LFELVDQHNHRLWEAGAAQTTMTREVVVGYVCNSIFFKFLRTSLAKNQTGVVSANSASMAKAHRPSISACTHFGHRLPIG
jgi:hypothetical protein